MSVIKNLQSFFGLKKTVTIGICALSLLSAKAQLSSTSNLPSMGEAPVDLVNPLIGSDRCRNFFMTPAARPFGMVKLSPDTEIFGYYHTGYQNSQPNILGFSHIHEFQMGGLVVMPITGKVYPVPGPERWKSGFNPAKQTVSPGYQKLHLDRYDIDVELTATKRVGFHRYTFKPKFCSRVLYAIVSYFWVCNMSIVIIQ
jgi:putative alpha-1,2-mannosidase